MKQFFLCIIFISWLIFSSCSNNSGEKKETLDSTGKSTEAKTTDSASRCEFILTPTMVDGKIVKSAELDLEKAEDYLLKFRDAHGSGCISFSIDNGHLKSLIDLTGSQRLRGYFGIKNPAAQDDITLMFVGVNASGANLVLPGNKVIDYTNPCPNDCPKKNGNNLLTIKLNEKRAPLSKTSPCNFNLAATRVQTNDKGIEILSAELPLTSAETFLNTYRAVHGSNCISFSVDNDDLTDLLGLPGCVRLRAYFGVKDENAPNLITLMFVGVDANGNNLVLPGDKVIDYTNPCPNDCPKNNFGNNMLTIK